MLIAEMQNHAGQLFNEPKKSLKLVTNFKQIWSECIFSPIQWCKNGKCANFRTDLCAIKSKIVHF